MNNEVKTVTWVGFVFTFLLFGLSLGVIVIYLRSYRAKDSAAISSVSFVSDDYLQADLKELD